jgi:hypothetical protein
LQYFRILTLSSPSSLSNKHSFPLSFLILIFSSKVSQKTAPLVPCAGFILFIAVFLLFFSLKTFQDPLYINISFTDAFKRLRQEPSIRNILIARFLLRFFYSWLTIYLPIYLHTEIGFSLGKIIGVMIPLALIPFFLIQLPLQIMNETYYFKQIYASNVNLIRMFRSLRPVGTICAPLVATIALLFIASYQYLFLILGIIILIGIPVSRSLERTG